MTAHDQNLALYVTTPHPCPYLPGRISTTLLLDPSAAVGSGLYEELLKQGFRRSGTLFYRPHCGQCRECVSVRIPTSHFRPSRSQSRVWRRNRDLEITCLTADFRDEHFELYRRYQAARHPGSTMDNPDPLKYIEFMVTSGVDTVFVEMRSREQLVAVAVCDRLRSGISAIYTFFDPDLAARSLGTYAILWQIKYAKTLDIPWVYLGYWIESCDKMRYKANYRPLYGFNAGRWHARRT